MGPSAFMMELESMVVISTRIVGGSQHGTELRTYGPATGFLATIWNADANLSDFSDECFAR
jgi:hypothetical protein